MNENDMVDIVDPTSGEVVDHCSGPTPQGSCPSAGPQGVVACSGSLIQGRNVGPEYWDLWVPPTSAHCPRAWNLENLGY